MQIQAAVDPSQTGALLAPSIMKHFVPDLVGLAKSCRLLSLRYSRSFPLRQIHTDELSSRGVESVFSLVGAASPHTILLAFQN